MASDWIIWQLADSAFPAGSLAHSNGLESAIQHGWVTDELSLGEFVNTMLRQLHAGIAVFVDRAWTKPARFTRHDDDCDLFLNSVVSNRASRAQGQTLLATASQTFDATILGEHLKLTRQRRTAGHLAPVFGLIAKTLEIERAEALRLFSFMNARSCLSAAVRMGVIGPLAAQRLMANLHWPRMYESVGGAEAFHDEPGSGQPVQTTPMLDLLQSTQDRLYSRLFQS